MTKVQQNHEQQLSTFFGWRKEISFSCGYFSRRYPAGSESVAPPSSVDRDQRSARLDASFSRRVVQWKVAYFH